LTTLAVCFVSFTAFGAAAFFSAFDAAFLTAGLVVLLLIYKKPDCLFCFWDYY